MTPKEFFSKKVKEISKEKLKSFPDDFLTSATNSKLSLPSKMLIIGNEFFGFYEVLTISGESFCQAESLIKAKYYVYSSRQKVKEVQIPNYEKEMEKAVKSYEKYLDDLIREIEKDYKKVFPEAKDSNFAVNEIFRLLNLTRL